MNKGYTGIKSELTQVRKSRDDWKRKYHQLNNLYAQLKEKYRKQEDFELNKTPKNFNKEKAN